MNQLTEQNIKTHVNILGWLLIAEHAVMLPVGLLTFTFFIGLGVASADEAITRILGIFGIFIVVSFVIISVPGILAGIGLLRGRRWARILGIFICFLGLLNVPVGLAIGIYGIYVLRQEAAEDYFAFG